MTNKLASVLLLTILLFCLLPPVEASEETAAVPQFGIGFDEVVIADSSDALSDPRDLEFHPGRANELWIANRATDSITIVQNTGLESQTSQNRQDSNKNHFLEEVSAIAFGSYHSEFDWQWGSAQETRNTFCGQGAPNNFMGPTLWPSSLSHFAMENQNNGNGLLGSHIDMNHESPDGMGIAHDSGNAYWYNDGYYGELVYYDFQVDHDTGEDDHSDGIVRRYTDIQLTRAIGIPGHMVLDKDSGILYIADAGANRVLWVNTDDATYNTQNIMGDSSRMEPLAEYSSITGVEWGVLASGLSRPSGIAIDGDRLFVSLNGNDRIVAYDLATDGKSATEAASVQTSAVSIMGLEIGPDGHLYYVDNGRDQVIRMDPYNDGDGDGVKDEDDNCPLTPNPDQANHDGDDVGDICDEDDDGDGILDLFDECAFGEVAWTSSLATDHDTDGCADVSEDSDDDNDGVPDTDDRCTKGDLAWVSTSLTDYDLDGCRDAGEDFDDDNDLICDADDWDGVCTPSSAGIDLCPTSPPSFFSIPSNDADRDGCEDAGEDTDDDNDGFADATDDCPTISGTSDLGTLIGCTDWDGDGYADTVDVFPVEPTQWSDGDGDGFGDEIEGHLGDYCPDVGGTSTEDRRGCPDSDGDGWSDPSIPFWMTSSGADAFPLDHTQHLDRDEDGYGDAEMGYQPDACPDVAGTSSEDVFGCLDSDGDGWSDVGDALPDNPTQHVDNDMDGYGESPTGDFPDGCPGLFGLSTEQRLGCPDADGDGWDDGLDAFAFDSRFWSDIDGDGHPDQPGTNMSDDCLEEAGSSSEDRIGCLDSDNDGWSDDADAFPKDASRHLAVTGPSLLLILGTVGVILIGSILGMLVIIIRRKNSKPSTTLLNPMTPVAITPPGLVVPPVAPTAPPLPAEGLPLGWTMDQWAWYGEDYLRNR